MTSTTFLTIRSFNHRMEPKQEACPVFIPGHATWSAYARVQRAGWSLDYDSTKQTTKTANRKDTQCQPKHDARLTAAVRVRNFMQSETQAGNSKTSRLTNARTG